MSAPTPAVWNPSRSAGAPRDLERTSSSRESAPEARIPAESNRCGRPHAIVDILIDILWRTTPPTISPNTPCGIVLGIDTGGPSRPPVRPPAQASTISGIHCFAMTVSRALWVFSPVRTQGPGSIRVQTSARCLPKARKRYYSRILHVTCPRSAPPKEICAELKVLTKIQRTSPARPPPARPSIEHAQGVRHCDTMFVPPPPHGRQLNSQNHTQMGGLRRPTTKQEAQHGLQVLGSKVMRVVYPQIHRRTSLHRHTCVDQTRIHMEISRAHPRPWSGERTAAATEG